MISIIQTELFRLKKSSLFWVMLCLCVAGPILELLVVVSILGIGASYVDGVDVIEALRTSPYGIVTSLNDFPQMMSGFSLLGLITTSVVLSKEFTDGTMRNVILANKSRKQMYFAYQLVAIFVGVTYMLANFVTIMIVCAPVYGFGNMSSGEAASACFCSLAMGLLAVIFVQTCMCMFLFVVRKQWATVLLPLLICVFGPALIELFVGIIALSKLIQGEVISELATSWIPLVNIGQYNAMALDGALIGKISLYYVLLSAIFVVGGYFTFEKTDLK